MFGLTSVLGGGVGSGLSRLKAGLTGATTPSDLMIGILGSRTVVQTVAVRCSLSRYYRIRTPTPELLVKQLRGMTELTASDDGIVKIAVEANARTLAARVANAYVAELDSFLRNSNVSRGRNMRIFIEHRLAQVESSLTIARDSLRSFQQTHKVVTVDDETRAAIDAYAKMRSQMSAKEAELDAARAAASDDNPYVVSLAREISGMRGELGKIEAGGSSAGFGVGFGVPFERLPGVAAEFARRYQDFRIQQEAYSTLYQQYEYARVLEARDAPTLTVLDYAVPPERRSFPRRTLIVCAVLGFSFFAGVAFAMIAEYFASIKTTRPEEYEAWRDIAGDLVSLVRALRHPVPRTRR
jgi:capsule polysaccharide export protein KpsE/RkpR